MHASYPLEGSENLQGQKNDGQKDKEVRSNLRSVERHGGLL
jgi:hypothetical protein